MPKTNYSSVIDMPANSPVFDFSIGKITDVIAGATTGIGKYNERRQDVYSDFYHDERNIHVGVDLFMPAGTPVRAFANGKVYLYKNRQTPGDYGPTIVCEHALGNKKIYALYGHLSLASLQEITVGKRFKSGQILGFLGTSLENGGWPPHVHLQLSWTAPKTCDMPGVVSPDQRADALKLYPDPALILSTLTSK